MSAEVVNKGLKDPYRFKLNYSYPVSYKLTYEIVKRIWNKEAKGVRFSVIKHFIVRAKIL